MIKTVFYASDLRFTAGEASAIKETLNGQKQINK